MTAAPRRRASNTLACTSTPGMGRDRPEVGVGTASPMPAAVAPTSRILPRRLRRDLAAQHGLVGIVGVGSGRAGEGHAQPVGALPLLMVEVITRGGGGKRPRLPVRAGAAGRGRAADGGPRRSLPTIHAAGDAVRVELHLAVADGGGGVGEDIKRADLAGEDGARGGLGHRQHHPALVADGSGQGHVGTGIVRAGGIEDQVDHDRPGTGLPGQVDEGMRERAGTRASARCWQRLASSMEMITTSSLAGWVQADSTPS
jgi:hypothetical protein